MDFPREAMTVEACLEHVRLWVGEPHRTKEEIVGLMKEIRDRAGEQVDFVESAIMAMLTSSGETLLLRRRPDDRSYPGGVYAFPGGRKDPDDVDVVTLIRREVPEETGVEYAEETEVGTIYSVLPERKRIFQITGFRTDLPPGPPPKITLSDEHDDALFICPKIALERDDEGSLPLAGRATRYWLELLLKK